MPRADFGTLYFCIYIDSIGNPDDITRPDGLTEDAVGPQTGATHAFAHLSVPTGAAAGSLNLAVNVQGYGVSSGYAATWSASTITLSLSAHSLEAIEGTDVTDFKSYYTSWIQGGGSYGFDIPLFYYTVNSFHVHPFQTSGAYPTVACFPFLTIGVFITC